MRMVHSILCLMAVVGHTTTTHKGGGGVSFQPWQIINLIGAPLLALMFLPPVVDDLRGWVRSLRSESPET